MKKFTPNTITLENKWRYTGAAFRPRFAGNFALADYTERVICSLDEFDKNYTSNVKLKPGEYIYRCSTERSRIAKIEYLVKINLLRGLVYFLENNEDDSQPVFSKKGIKVCYLNTLPEHEQQ